MYIPLLIIIALPENPSPFNFKVGGHKIARIRDFQNDNPNLWPVDYLDWTNALAQGIEALATTSVVYDPYVYFYPLYRYNAGNIHIWGNILARIPINRLEDPAGHFEYLMKENIWKKICNLKKRKLFFRRAFPNSAFAITRRIRNGWPFTSRLKIRGVSFYTQRPRNWRVRGVHLRLLLNPLPKWTPQALFMINILFVTRARNTVNSRVAETSSSLMSAIQSRTSTNRKALSAKTLFSIGRRLSRSGADHVIIAFNFFRDPEVPVFFSKYPEAEPVFAKNEFLFP